MSSKTTIANTAMEALRDVGLTILAIAGVIAAPLLIIGERSYALAKWASKRKKS